MDAAAWNDEDPIPNWVLVREFSPETGGKQRHGGNAHHRIQSHLGLPLATQIARGRTPVLNSRPVPPGTVRTMPDCGDFP
jgi:hypothetical protein